MDRQQPNCSPLFLPRRFELRTFHYHGSRVRLDLSSSIGRRTSIGIAILHSNPFDPPLQGKIACNEHSALGSFLTTDQRVAVIPAGTTRDRATIASDKS